jgi:hypothetical protein
VILTSRQLYLKRSKLMILLKTFLDLKKSKMSKEKKGKKETVLVAIWEI